MTGKTNRVNPDCLKSSETAAYRGRNRNYTWWMDIWPILLWQFLCPALCFMSTYLLAPKWWPFTTLERLMKST